jgi:hypothetical protein
VTASLLRPSSRRYSCRSASAITPVASGAPLCKRVPPHQTEAIPSPALTPAAPLGMTLPVLGLVAVPGAPLSHPPHSSDTARMPMPIPPIQCHARPAPSLQNPINFALHKKVFSITQAGFVLGMEIPVSPACLFKGSNWPRKIITRLLVESGAASSGQVSACTQGISNAIRPTSDDQREQEFNWIILTQSDHREAGHCVFEKRRRKPRS